MHDAINKLINSTRKSVLEIKLNMALVIAMLLDSRVSTLGQLMPRKLINCNNERAIDLGKKYGSPKLHHCTR